MTHHDGALSVGVLWKVSLKTWQSMNVCLRFEKLIKFNNGFCLMMNFPKKLFIVVKQSTGVVE